MHKHLITFRWPIKQVAEQQCELLLPNNGEPLLNQAAVEAMRLSDSEIDRAEDAIIKAIAVIQ